MCLLGFDRKHFRCKADDSSVPQEPLSLCSLSLWQCTRFGKGLPDACAARWACQTEYLDCFHWSFEGRSAFIPIKPLNIIVGTEPQQNECACWHQCPVLVLGTNFISSGCTSRSLKQQSILHQYSIKPHILHFHKWLNQSVDPQRCSGHLSALPGPCWSSDRAQGTAAKQRHWAGTLSCSEGILLQVSLGFVVVLFFFFNFICFFF